MEIERRRVLTGSLAMASATLLPGCTSDPELNEALTQAVVEVLIEVLVCDGDDCIEDDGSHHNYDGGDSKNRKKKKSKRTLKKILKKPG